MNTIIEIGFKIFIYTLATAASIGLILYWIKTIRFAIQFIKENK